MKPLLRLALFLAVCSLYSFGQVPITSKPGTFKNWNYSPTAVFGLTRLTNVSQRSYYKIWKADPATVKIEQHDATGKIASTVTVRFVKGLIGQMVSVNRWGDTNLTTKFASAGPGQLSVTETGYGENNLFPAKSARYVYKLNLLTEVRYLSFDGKLTKDSNGVAIIRYKRESVGNRYSLIKEMTFFDENDQPVNSKGWDAHKITYEHDDRGNRISESYFDTDDQPLTNRFGGFRIRSKYNEADQVIRSETYGLSDELVNNSYGVALVEYEYSNGLATKAVRSDASGRITKASAAGDGLAIIRYEYDANGFEKRRSYFDEFDKPMNGPNGYQSVSYLYSPTGMLLRVEYFDKAGGSATDRSGVHRYDYGRDDLGRLTSTSYFDKQNNPMEDDVNQVFMIKYKYDEQGRRYSRSFWKNDSEKMPRWDGFHESVSRYNEDGQEIESLRYDMNGKLFAGDSGYSRVVISYDPFGRVSERKWFNDQSPATLANTFAQGFHSIRFTYDSNGRIAYLQYFDSVGKPVNADISLDGNSISYHKIEFIYQGNRIVEQRLYRAGSNIPDLIIDCLKNNYVATSGIGMGRKNQ